MVMNMLCAGASSWVYAHYSVVHPKSPIREQTAAIVHCGPSPLRELANSTASILEHAASDRKLASIFHATATKITSEESEDFNDAPSLVDENLKDESSVSALKWTRNQEPHGRSVANVELCISRPFRDKLAALLSGWCASNSCSDLSFYTRKDISLYE